MSLFQRFAETKEEGFREEFIKPLLIRLGFFGISNRHGVNEFGKDYVFSEFDGFGQVRHLVIQAKHAESIRQGNGVYDLIGQVRQCFDVPYTLPSAPNEVRHVSAVYVFNSGEITDNAEKQIRHALPKEIASNVRFFSGPQLEVLASANIQRNDEEVRRRLRGLLIQLTLNLETWKSIAVGMSPNDRSATQWDVRGSLTHGVEEMLTHPLPSEMIRPAQLFDVWQFSRTIDAIVNRWYLGGRGSPEFFKRDMEVLAETISRGSECALDLYKSVMTALESLPAQVL